MLKLRHLLLAGIALLTLTPVVAGGPAFAADTIDYAAVGGWNVQYNPEGNHCWMAQTFGRDTTVFVTRRQGTWTMAIGNPAWTPRLSAGMHYRITMVLDGSDKWQDTFEARSIGTDGEIALYFDNISTDFLLSFMRRYGVQIYIGSKQEPLTNLPLVDSAAAMLKLAECSNRADANGGARPVPAQQRRPQVREFST